MQLRVYRRLVEDGKIRKQPIVFFDNERVEPEKIDESHLRATLLRMDQEKVMSS